MKMQLTTKIKQVHCSCVVITDADDDARITNINCFWK